MPRSSSCCCTMPGRFRPDMSPDQIQAIIQRYVAWRSKVQQNGRAVMGHKLHDAQGRVMRGAGGAMKVTDGPYAEAREVIGGLFVDRGGELRRGRRAEQGLPAPRLRHHRNPRSPANVALVTGLTP